MNIARFLNKKFTCSSCNREHFIPTQEVISKKNACAELPSFLQRLMPDKSLNILILSDAITYEIAGEKCEETLQSKGKITSLVLKHERGEAVHAEEKHITKVINASTNVSAILTVGTGSITDIGKYSANILKIPVFCFPTAPSMNAYTSNVAAFLSHGLKVTLPVSPARGVIADIDILAESPLLLIKSGFADSLAKSFANADWCISSMLTNEPFCLLPFQIATEAEKKYITKGKELISRDRNSVAGLLEGLHLGGFSMVIAGASSPASGGEHLISHFLDMYAHKHGQNVYAYHGLQVGLGVRISSAIYEELKKLSLTDVQTLLAKRHIDYDREIAKLFPDDRALITNEFKKKIPIIATWKNELSALWPRMQKEAFSLVHTPPKIKHYLTEAECPLHFKDIGVSDELAQQAIQSARYIRGRFTVLDIADELGILDDSIHYF